MAWKNGQLKVEELSEGSSPDQEWEIEELYHELNGTYAEYPGLSMPTEKTFALHNKGNGMMASIGKSKWIQCQIKLIWFRDKAKVTLSTIKMNTLSGGTVR